MRLMIVIFIICMGSVVNADVIYLKNGNFLEGKIVNVDVDKKQMQFQMAFDEEISNSFIYIKTEEVKSVMLEEKYRNMQVRKHTKVDKKRVREEHLQRLEDAQYFNDQYRRRHERKMKDKLDRKLAKERADKEHEYEKELLQIKHEQRKDLIDYSKSKYVNPSVNIYENW